MDNPEKWQHWVHKSQDKDKQNKKNTKQKNKKMSTDPTKFRSLWFSRSLIKLICDKFTDI